MGKTRKKKTPITAISSSDAASSNPQATRTVIRKFHVLLKRQSQLKIQAAPDEELADIEADLEKLGGLEAYQKMSSIGQGTDRGGGSEKVFIKWMRDLDIHRNQADKLQLLEVGALKHDNYQLCAQWIDCHPMDLRSRHPAIKEQDFLLLDKVENQAKWDAISLSLVLNFVPQPRDRGKMLLMAHDMLKPNGLLFLALPLPCVINSRYLTLQHLKELMQTIGFVQEQERWKEGGKMAYWLYCKSQQASLPAWNDFTRKEVLVRGNSRNNFSILL